MDLTYERDCSVRGGEVVSPILSNTAETWQGLRQVCGVITSHGGTRSAATGSRITVPGFPRRYREPTYIIWLRHGHPDAYARSLAQAGVIDVAVHHS